jgi:hypothetical protein
MFLVRHPDSGNWFVTPEAWTWEDTEGYLAFGVSRDHLMALARLLNDMEFKILRNDNRLKRIEEALNY